MQQTSISALDFPQGPTGTIQHSQPLHQQQSGQGVESPHTPEVTEKRRDPEARKAIASTLWYNSGRWEYGKRAGKRLPPSPHTCIITTKRVRCTAPSPKGEGMHQAHRKGPRDAPHRLCSAAEVPTATTRHQGQPRKSAGTPVAARTSTPAIEEEEGLATTRHRVPPLEQEWDLPSGPPAPS